MSLSDTRIPHKTTSSSSQHRSRFPVWPDRTRAELERLRLTTHGISPIPPRWRRISPAQYLKDRPASVRIPAPSGRTPSIAKRMTAVPVLDELSQGRACGQTFFMKESWYAE